MVLGMGFYKRWRFGGGKRPFRRTVFPPGKMPRLYGGQDAHHYIDGAHGVTRPARRREDLLDITWRGF